MGGILKYYGNLHKTLRAASIIAQVFLNNICVYVSVNIYSRIHVEYDKKFIYMSGKEKIINV